VGWSSIVLGLWLAASGPAAATSTSTSAASPRDVELARYLFVLENWELLRDMEVVELLPVIEEEVP